jgi:hypothetical protein
MKCEKARDRIAQLDHPVEASGTLADHLAACAACRAWQATLVRIEKVASRLPVPTSPSVGAKKTETIDAILNPSRLFVSPASSRSTWIETIRKNWHIGVAGSAIAVGVVVYMQTSRTNRNDVANAPADPLLEKVVLAKCQVDVARTTADRLKAMADLSDVLYEQAKLLSKISPGADMDSIAEMYGQVGDAMVKQANWLNGEERRNLLTTYANRLAKAEDEATRMLSESPVGSANALKEIAGSARRGKETIVQLQRDAS